MTTTASEESSAAGPSPSDCYRLSAPNSYAAPKVVRDMVAGVLVATEHPGLVDIARVCVSDLVTNVVVHTQVLVLTVEVTVRRNQVVVSVRDDDPDGRPYPRKAEADDESGRGLLMIQGLADNWGVTWIGGPAPIGKCVWFELHDKHEWN
jgi:anti-sigma regulatory factor (Ser/Thr protein kinase)